MAQPESRPRAKANGWHNGSIGGLARSASRWLAQRFNRRIDQRRKPMVGATVGLEDRLKAKAGERSED
jgi:hypothetical protein